MNGIYFTEVTAHAGLDNFKHTNGAAGNKWFPETMGAGIGVIDYNNDQWPDILVVNGANWENNKIPALKLYRNNRDKTFSDVTSETGLADTKSYGMGLTIGDYNNDSFDDIFLTGIFQNTLLENRNGSYLDKTASASLSEDKEWSTSATWLDADCDGWLDLYVANYVQWTPETDLFCSMDGKIKSYCTPEQYAGIPGRFYHNNGNGTFSDWTIKAGFNKSPGKALGVTSFDFNKDKWPDLIVTNDTQRDEFYVNNGDGTFTEKGAISGMAYDQNGRARAGMGVDAGVVDSTGQETVFIGNFSKETIGIYRYSSNGFFMDRAISSNIGKSSLLTLTFGLFLFDVDLDGDMDLFAANGHISSEIESVQDIIKYKQSSHLFLNNANGVFKDVAKESGAISSEIIGRGAVRLDYDRDGDFDVLVSENSAGMRLWESNVFRPGKNYLKIKLTGTSSNTNAFGSSITLIAGKRKMFRYVKAASSYLSQSENNVIFGLDDHNKIDSLIVDWPGGKQEILTDLLSNKEIIIREN